MTPIELAKDHGAFGEYIFNETIYAFDKEQLEAYSRALVAPYVEALELIAQNKYSGLFTLSNPPMCQRALWAEQALAAHRKMFGDSK